MSNSHNGKKSQSSLIILVVLVVIFSVLFVLSTFKTETFKSQTIKSIQLSGVSKYLDMTKGFSRHSGLLASHAACYDIAYKGGDSTEATRTWVCNGPWVPEVDEVRFFLGQETLEFLNRYVSNHKVEDPLIKLNNFTCVNYNVNKNSVTKGEVDEKFNIEAFGSEINITRGEDYTTAKNELDTEIQRVRFWYMYRIFRNWAETTTLPQDICRGLYIMCQYCSEATVLDSCEANCKIFHLYVLQEVEKARKYLASLFNDPDIVCTADLNCCKSMIGENTGPPGCLDWEEAPCGGCGAEEPRTLCVNSILRNEKINVRPFDIKGTESDKTRFLQFNVGVSIFWKHPFLCRLCEAPLQEPRASITATFSCIDTKYSLSV